MSKVNLTKFHKAEDKMHRN